MNLAAHTQVVDSAGCSRRVCYGAARARATPSAHRRASCQHASLPRLAVKHAPLMEVAPLRRGARPAGLVVSASSTAVESAPAPASMVPYYAAFLVFGCAVNTIGPMLPLLAAQVGLSPVDMAPLLSAKGAAGLAGSFLCPLLPLVRCTAAIAPVRFDLTPGGAGCADARRPALHRPVLRGNTNGHLPAAAHRRVLLRRSCLPSGALGVVSSTRDVAL